MLVLLLPLATVHAEDSSCRCLNSLSDFGLDGDLTVTIGDRSYTYAQGYGIGSCKQHDQGKSPFCDGSRIEPAWCKDTWCYVDPEDCQTNTAQSSYFPRLVYSYATCGSTNTFTQWFVDEVGSGTRVLSELVGVVSDYLKATITDLEESEIEVRSRTSPCGYDTSCSCCGCEENSLWAPPGKTTELTFLHTTTMAYPSPSDHPPIVDQCLAGTVAASFTRVALKEASRDRIGFEYFGSQQGTYMQWPGIQDCSGGYDPRFRPWYATAASGPKSIVVVIDVSGSMAGSRIELARQAAIRVVNYTLTESDYASVVLFQSRTARYSSSLIRMTEGNRRAAADWINENARASGGTNFVGAFDDVWDIFTNSEERGCSRVVLFLSDGEPNTWSASDSSSVRSRAAQFGNVHILTYALGSFAPTAILKEIACDNRGIFYPVGDNDDLPSIMASYYDLLVQFASVCSPRYTKYTDLYTGTELVAACLAAFKKPYPSSEVTCDPSFIAGTETRELIGVACIDFSLIASQAQLKANPGYQAFLNTYESLNEVCGGSSVTEAQLEELRERVSSQSTCSSLGVNVREKDAAYTSRSGYSKDCVLNVGSHSNGGDLDGTTIAGAGAAIAAAAVILAVIVIRRRRSSRPSAANPRRANQPTAQQNDSVPMGQAVVPMVVGQPVAAMPLPTYQQQTMTSGHTSVPFAQPVYPKV